MKKRSCTCSIKYILPFFLLIGSSCKQKTLFFPESLCLENITIVDPISGEVPNQTVVITAGKIQQVGPTDQLPLSKENKIIDGQGKFLIPGLWDAHVHFAFMEEMAPRMFDLFLRYGITSVRDTGGKIAFVNSWKNKAEEMPEDAPRVMVAGPLLDGMPNVYDGSDPMHPPLSEGHENVDAVSQTIDHLIDQDVDLLKAYEMLTPEQFAHITEVASQHNLPVTGHVPLLMDVIQASNAGLNSMEHLRNLELSCASDSDELLEKRRHLMKTGKHDPGGVLRSRIHNAQRQHAVQNYSEERADQVLAVLKKNRTWQIPTLALSTGAVERPFADPKWQVSFADLSSETEAKWKSQISDFEKTEISDFQKTYASWMRMMVGKINKAGIDIMAGTDCPIFFLTPGRSLHEELEVLVKSGLTPLEALKTATINPARYFNMESELGRIKEAMWADMVILNSNPLEDIGNTKDISAVIKQGKLHSVSNLKAALKSPSNIE